MFKIPIFNKLALIISVSMCSTSSVFGLSDKVIEDDSTKLSTTVLWSNEYFDLEIVNGYQDCDWFMISNVGKDTIEPEWDIGCSIAWIPFILTNTKLDSIVVEQSRLETIAISQRESDGFSSASLSEVVLQSNWVPYDLKNDMYVLQFSEDDPRFVIDEKPPLTENFIIDLLKTSEREVAKILLESFVQTEKFSFWENCTVIIRISGINADKERIIKYIADHGLCIQD